MSRSRYNSNIYSEIRAKIRNLNLDGKPQIWVGNSPSTEIRNPTKSLGKRLLEMTGFIDIALRPKILSPKSKW